MIQIRSLWGSWAQRLSVPLTPLTTGNSLHSASMTFPEFQILAAAGRVREGLRDHQGETAREAGAQPRGRAPAPLPGTHTRPVSCPADTGTRSKRELLTARCPGARRPRLGGTRGLTTLTPSPRQKNAHELITPSLSLYSFLSKWRLAVLKVLPYCVPLCLAK